MPCGCLPTPMPAWMRNAGAASGAAKASCDPDQDLMAGAASARIRSRKRLQFFVFTSIFTRSRVQTQTGSALSRAMGARASRPDCGPHPVARLINRRAGLVHDAGREEEAVVHAVPALQLRRHPGLAQPPGVVFA